MLTVINVGICLGLVATALVLLFIARNIMWSIPDAQFAKKEKWKVLCWIALGLVVVIGFLFPRNWQNGNQYNPQPIAPYFPQIAPTTSVPAPAVSKTVEAPQPSYEPVSRPAPIVQYEPPVQVEQKPAAKVDRWAGFSATAQSVIAKDILNLENDAFQKLFTIHCLDATSSTRQITSYGMNSSVVVVTGRFKLASVDQTDGQAWSKTFSVSETVFPDEFQGLDSNTTGVLLANSLKEQISNDKETTTVLKKASKP